MEVFAKLKVRKKERIAGYISQSRVIVPTLLLRGVQRVEPHDDVAHVHPQVVPLLGHASLGQLGPGRALEGALAVALLVLFLRDDFDAGKLGVNSIHFRILKKIFTKKLTKIFTKKL